MSAMPGSDPVDPVRSGVKLTYDDFVLFPDDGKRHELIDGEHLDRAVEVSRERGDVLTTPLLQGLDLPLQRIFRE